MRELLYTVGVDLGQVRDYTAVAVLETQLWAPSHPDAASGWLSPAGLIPSTVDLLWQRHEHGWPSRPPLALRMLERERERSYVDLVRAVAQLMQQPPLSVHGAILVIDATGVGVAVHDLFREAGLYPARITIHGGDAVKQDLDTAHWRVPKRDLAGAVQALLQTERLKIAASLPLALTLREELRNFRVTIDPRTAHDSYSAWREKDHDDLVLAVSLAGWWRDKYWRHFDTKRTQPAQRQEVAA